MPEDSITQKEASRRFDEYGLENLCRDVSNGRALSDITAQFGASPYHLRRWFKADPERQREYETAREESAEALIEMAETALIEASCKVSVSRAAHLANHYRWEAERKNPRRYANKQQIEHSGKMTLGELVANSYKIEDEQQRQD